MITLTVFPLLCCCSSVPKSCLTLMGFSWPEHQHGPRSLLRWATFRRNSWVRPVWLGWPWPAWLLASLSSSRPSATTRRWCCTVLLRGQGLCLRPFNPTVYLCTASLRQLSFNKDLSILHERLFLPLLGHDRITGTGFTFYCQITGKLDRIYEATAFRHWTEGSREEGDRWNADLWFPLAASTEPGGLTKGWNPRGRFLERRLLHGEGESVLEIRRAAPSKFLAQNWSVYTSEEVTVTGGTTGKKQAGQSRELTQGGGTCLHQPQGGRPTKGIRLSPWKDIASCSSVQFSRSVVSDSLWPYGL